MDRVNAILLGAIATMCMSVGLFFLRFWRQGRDPFFLLFALSFFVEGGNRIALALSANPQEGSPGIYLVRLGSFLLIIAAVVAKNRGGRGRGRSTARRARRSVPPRMGE
jgi:uncharacterized membrane protein HdeD (DUF308 family)